ncbi:hypothetical protein [Mycobacterium avium]|uniref:hypothetical protein n=2 Tax=Mycobacterium avium TaxID=1764 RepID=UPI00124A17F9|nr:hypothetical protein [Mycobacterium avium]MBZ4547416.1 hypothetical protein [Mycobacterium avium subsp. hominissuis]MBZ4566741.1 hypothetical protein [Mycobacterium avium subsp. hominissuis]
MSAEMSGGRLSEHVAEWMCELAQDRPVFHSEADFQLALALVMTRHGARRVRLERRIRLPKPLHNKHQLAVDVLATVDNRRIGLELKYPRKTYTGTVLSDGEPEEYFLSGGAADIEAAYYWHDAERIELLLAESIIDAGASIMLSNVPYWLSTMLTTTVGHAFALCEDRSVGPTTLAWSGKPYSDPVELTSQYLCRWRPFSTPSGTEFRYMILEGTARP